MLEEQEILTEDNYFSHKMQNEYLSTSQIKDCVGVPAQIGCELRWYATIRGGYKPKTSDALLYGQYVDTALLTPERMPDFIKKNSHMFTKSGKLYAKFQRAQDSVERVKQDEFFMRTLVGDHQTIMTGEIAGSKVKIKMDVYCEGKYITDLKTTQSITKGYWNPLTKRRETFLHAYNYFLQAAIYQEIVYQNTGKRLPFFISAISKEPITDFEVIQIAQEDMDEQLEMIKPHIQHMQAIKDRQIDACKCGVCHYCIEKKKLTRPIFWQDIMGQIEEEGVDDTDDESETDA